MPESDHAKPKLIPNVSQQDILSYTQLFRNEAAIHPNAHPGALVLEMLAEEDRAMHGQQLATWYEDYSKKRNGQAAFKKMEEIAPHLHKTH